MERIRFEYDYACGAHPRVMEALARANGEALPGYGTDRHCLRAARLVRESCQAPQADVHFLPGGTQTNATVIAAALRPHQGVLCARTGHINGHEAGAVEATGHKVLPLPAADGKLTAAQVREVCLAHFQDPSAEHLVQPGMLYLSQPTELGTVYTREELEALRAVCLEFGLLLYVDGARLPYALAAGGASLPQLARLCDAFCLGGTKAGTLLGEAVVLTRPELRRYFRSLVKQRGGMLAKGWLLGVQFEALLEDGLYQRIGRQAVDQALCIQRALRDRGFPLLSPSPTNQQFPILPDGALRRLEERFTCCFWEKAGPEHTAVRLCTSWATSQADVDALAACIASL